MTSQGSASGRFTRAIKQRNLFIAEMAIREMGGLASLLEGLDYLDLLAEVKPEKLEHAALRWHGRLELEASMMTLGESQLALAELASLCAGERSAIELLRKLVRRVRPSLACARQVIKRRSARRYRWLLPVANNTSIGSSFSR